MRFDRRWPLILFLDFLLLSGLIYDSGALLFASPPEQGPKSEPTKPPYVFPTPVFIPTFPADSITTPPSISGPGATPLPVAPAASERTYTVQQGDSPWTISQKVYGTGAKFALILSANGLTEASVLQVGTVLKIPSAGSSIEPVSPVAILSVPTVQIPSPGPATPTTETLIVETPSPTPVPSKSTNSSGDLLSALINIGTALLLVGAAIFGALSFVAFRGSRKTGRISGMVRRIRTK